VNCQHLFGFQKKKLKCFPVSFVLSIPGFFNMSDPISNRPNQQEEDPELDDLLDGKIYPCYSGLIVANPSDLKM
jgi:hypothetical protein